MKAILFESNEERVNLLRKVFDIDKYKRIKDNCEVYAKSLRERRRFLEGALVYFVQKKSELEQKSVDLDCVRNELLDRSKSLKEIKQKVSEQRLLVSNKESEVRKFNEVKVSHSALKSSIMTKQQSVDSLKQELDLIQKNILKLEGEIKVVSFVSDDELNKCRSMVECKEKVLVDKRVSFAEFSVRMKQSNEVKSQINVLSICPVCKQKVSDEYKSSIFHVEDDKVLALQIGMKDLEAGMKLLSSEVSVARTELQRLQSLSESARVFSFQNAQLDVLRSTLLQKRNYFESISSEIGKASLFLSDMEKELSSSKLIEDFGIAKSILDSLISSEKDAEVAYQRLIEKENMLKQLVDSLSLEVEGMKQKRILVQQLSEAHQWVSDFFAPLVTCIEQHVMARVHRDFTCLFQDWFAVLVNDEVMSARLDEFFTPVILQNGYELSVENLSGGEKTACALAYRLALNKVINNLISAIKTKDLLILDEPTDGFSDSQLDTMRDVLLQLGVKQLIIVSHERKIEGFVDYVMRIVKNEHVSSVEQANI